MGSVEEELNRKGEKDAGWSRTWREGERKVSTGGCGEDPARERTEGGEGASEAAGSGSAVCYLVLGCWLCRALMSL